jgi:hypothetical protein
MGPVTPRPTGSGGRWSAGHGGDQGFDQGIAPDGPFDDTYGSEPVAPSVPPGAAVRQSTTDKPTFPADTSIFR